MIIRPDMVEIVRKKAGEWFDEQQQIHVARPADEQQGRLKQPIRLIKRFD